MTTITVQHPFHPWLYFPFHREIVFVFDLETRIYNDEEFIRFLEPFEITDICRRVKEQLDLISFEWGYENGVCKLWCDKQELSKVYEIANKLIRLDCRLTFNDGSKVSIGREQYPVNRKKQEELLLQLLQRCEKDNMETPVHFHIAVHRTDFWTNDYGKLFASQLRRKYYLPDRQEEDFPRVSEYWGEKNFLSNNKNEQGILRSEQTSL